MFRRKMQFYILTAIFLFASSIQAQQEIELWTNQIPPYSKIVMNEEYVDECWGGVRCAHKVTVPNITLYPSNSNAETWLLIMPGGGYDVVAIFHEGSDIAEAFVKRGIPSAVLKYRIPDIRTATSPEKVPFSDFRRAMEILRLEQKKIGIENGKIGVVGFSASGHLAVYSMVHPDPNIQLNPDFSILIYGTSDFNPVNQLWLEENLYYRPLTFEEKNKEILVNWINKNTPPAFLVHAFDDDVSLYTESTIYAENLLKQGIEVEMHMFPKGGHGFGLGYDNDGTSQWIDLAVNWINRLE